MGDLSQYGKGLNLLFFYGFRKKRGTKDASLSVANLKSHTLELNSVMAISGVLYNCGALMHLHRMKLL